MFLNMFENYSKFKSNNNAESELGKGISFKVYFKVAVV